MQGSYSGNTLAFQAKAESSILLPCSKFAREVATMEHRNTGQCRPMPGPAMKSGAIVDSSAISSSKTCCVATASLTQTTRSGIATTGGPSLT